MDTFRMDETMRFKSPVNTSEEHFEISQQLTRLIWDAYIVSGTVEFWETING